MAGTQPDSKVGKEASAIPDAHSHFKEVLRCPEAQKDLPRKRSGSKRALPTTNAAYCFENLNMSAYQDP